MMLDVSARQAPVGMEGNGDYRRRRTQAALSSIDAEFTTLTFTIVMPKIHKMPPTAESVHQHQRSTFFKLLLHFVSRSRVPLHDR